MGRAHVARHLRHHPSRGSKFSCRSFEEVLVLVRQAIAGVRQQLNGPAEEDTIVGPDAVWLRVRMPGVVGVDGVVALDTLPPRTRVRRAWRGPTEDRIAVNVAACDPVPTRNLVLWFRHDQAGWFLYSAYPGALAPPLTDGAFWRRHAFCEGAGCGSGWATPAPRKGKARPRHGGRS